MKKIREHLFISNISLLLLFIITTLILRLFNLRFRMWFNILIIGFVLLILMVSLLRFIIYKYNKFKISIIISIISIIFLSNILIFIIFSSSSIKTFLHDINQVISIKEGVITLDNKRYVAISENTNKKVVSYYNYYGPFLIGTNLEMIGTTSDDTMILTFYNDLGNVIKSEEVIYSKDKNNYTIENNHILYPEEKEDLETFDYLLPEEEEVLYERKFDDKIIRFTKYEVALGQKNLVHVIISQDGGKSYRRIGGHSLSVSTKARFTFVDKLNGFAIDNGLIRLSDNYGMDVTTDGGFTFETPKFNYQNDSIEYLKVLDVPYYEDGLLKLKCSIMVINKQTNEYENQEIIFISKNQGLTWTPENK